MILHRLLPRPAPLLTFSFLKSKSLPIPLHTTSVLTIPTAFPSFSSLATRTLLFPQSALSLSGPEAVLEPPNAVVLETEYVDVIESEERDFGEKEEEEIAEEARLEQESKRRLPDLSVKEKKELASYAHSLGKKLKSQQVGKSGVTGTVVTALIETLEANELLKLKIHNNCPGELDDVVKQLEEGTGSVVVGRIGRTVILYRPSLTKLKAEEKKKHAQDQTRKILLRKQPTQEHHQSRSQLPRQSARGRRGSSRLEHRS